MFFAQKLVLLVDDIPVSNQLQVDVVLARLEDLALVLLARVAERLRVTAALLTLIARHAGNVPGNDHPQPATELGHVGELRRCLDYRLHCP